MFVPKPPAPSQSSVPEVSGGRDRHRSRERKSNKLYNDPGGSESSEEPIGPTTRADFIISAIENAPRPAVGDKLKAIQKESDEARITEQKDLHEQLNYLKHSIISQPHFVLDDLRY